MDRKCFCFLTKKAKVKNANLKLKSRTRKFRKVLKGLNDNFKTVLEKNNKKYLTQSKNSIFKMSQLPLSTYRHSYL